MTTTTLDPALISATPSIFRRFLGDPNPAISFGDKMKWGVIGSISLDTRTGRYMDNYIMKSGDVLDFLIERGVVKNRVEAMEWLRADARYGGVRYA